MKTLNRIQIQIICCDAPQRPLITTSISKHLYMNISLAKIFENPTVTQFTFTKTKTNPVTRKALACSFNFLESVHFTVTTSNHIMWLEPP